ncbi:hypothetical protein CEXT_559201 [Caerostris extrusa]|uniref:Uncharacterized protein n=1 Tax=Caerostris extrusa TaxID=172846 RepID=A0AAV4NZS1_CAEEX|nr:hypothetical protein CEXT_559201 [Caerostris extrusa]
MKRRKSKQNSTDSNIPLAIRERSRTHRTRSVSSAEHVMSRSFHLHPPSTTTTFSRYHVLKLLINAFAFVTSYFCKTVSVARCHLVSDLF